MELIASAERDSAEVSLSKLAPEITVEGSNLTPERFIELSRANYKTIIEHRNKYPDTPYHGECSEDAYHLISYAIDDFNFISGRLTSSLVTQEFLDLIHSPFPRNIN